MIWRRDECEDEDEAGDNDDDDGDGDGDDDDGDSDNDDDDDADDDGGDDDDDETADSNGAIGDDIDSFIAVTLAMTLKIVMLVMKVILESNDFGFCRGMRMMILARGDAGARWLKFG